MLYFMIRVRQNFHFNQKYGKEKGDILKRGLSKNKKYYKMTYNFIINR